MSLENLRQLESSLWEAADQLRANSKLNASEYYMPVLGLIFLRHATNRFDVTKGKVQVGLLKLQPVVGEMEFSTPDPQHFDAAGHRRRCLMTGKPRYVGVAIHLAYSTRRPVIRHMQSGELLQGRRKRHESRDVSETLSRSVTHFEKTAIEHSSEQMIPAMNPAIVAGFGPKTGPQWPDSPGRDHHRRSIRLHGYDYSRAGAYFVTICTQNRECLFGKIENGNMRLNDAGRMVQTTWNELAFRFAMVELDEFIIMPNHVHGVIVLSEPEVLPNTVVGAPLVGALSDADETRGRAAGEGQAQDLPLHTNR